MQGLNKNWLADDSGLTSLKVAEAGPRRNYIPYTNRKIHWHNYYRARYFDRLVGTGVLE